MTVVYEKEQTSNNVPYVKDGSGLAKALKWPVGLSIKERLKLYNLGKKDARSHKAKINEYNELSSVFCESLVQSTNQKIELEWQQCNEACFKATSKMDEINLKKKKLNEQIHNLMFKRDNALDTLRNNHYDGDDVVSEHLAQRRQRQREKRIIDEYEMKISSLKTEIEELELETIPFQNIFNETEEIARSNEQLARTDYLWRMSVYAYGASNYIKVTPDLVNMNYLTNEPKQIHDKLFNDVKKGFTTLADDSDDENLDINNHDENSSIHAGTTNGDTSTNDENESLS